MKVYLGGPINGCSDDEAMGWRESVKPILADHGHAWADPMDRDYRGQEALAYREIVESDKADIDGCDLLLMSCPQPSVGTSMEILYGWQQNKIVVGVIPIDHTPSPWLSYHANLHSGSVVEVARYVAKGNE